MNKYFKRHFYVSNLKQLLYFKLMLLTYYFNSFDECCHTYEQLCICLRDLHRDCNIGKILI